MSKPVIGHDGKHRMVFREDWLLPASVHLAKAESEALRDRICAMALRRGGNPYKVIERLTGVKRQAIHRMLKRAERVAPDGLAYGYRAALPYLQIDAKTPSRWENHPWHRSMLGKSVPFSLPPPL